MIFGCIGEHLSHSFSKEIHNKLMKFDYELKEIEPDKLGDFLKSKDFKGINVTIPYKQAVIPYLDEISDIAKRIGAVNTIVNKDGRLFGTNTDYFGMTELIKKAEIDVFDKKVLILGSGGTSKTATVVCDDLNVKEIIKVSRTPSNDFVSYEDAVAIHNDADIIINTTPCGMYPNFENTPINLCAFKKLSGVVDAIYNPLRSNFVLEAQNRGLNAVGGLYMLVAQAAIAEEYFLDIKIDNSVIDSVYNSIYKQKFNIVLSGMPGCGKSTIAKEISKILNFELIDTDKLIEEKEKVTIKEIFEMHGEKYFRDCESDVIKSIMSKNGCVISTGGGAVLRKDNVVNLKHNGEIVYLNRPIDQIIATSDRPLSSNRDDLIKRFNERKDIYENTCDLMINIGSSLEDNIKKIMENIQ